MTLADPKLRRKIDGTKRRRSMNRAVVRALETTCLVDMPDASVALDTIAAAKDGTVDRVRADVRTDHGIIAAHK